MLKAVADAERSTRRSSAAPSSPPRYPLKGSLGSSPGSASPPRSSGNDASGSKSSRRFRSVATAAAEEAKVRLRVSYTRKALRSGRWGLVLKSEESVRVRMKGGEVVHE